MNVKDKIDVYEDSCLYFISKINEYKKNIEKYLNIISNVLSMKISMFNIKSYYEYLYYDYNNKLKDIYTNIKNNYYKEQEENEDVIIKKNIFFINNIDNYIIFSKYNNISFNIFINNIFITDIYFENQHYQVYKKYDNYILRYYYQYDLINNKIYPIDYSKTYDYFNKNYFRIEYILIKSIKTISLKQYNNNIFYYSNNKIYFKNKFINDNKYCNILYYNNKIRFKYFYNFKYKNYIKTYEKYKNKNSLIIKLII